MNREKELEKIIDDATDELNEIRWDGRSKELRKHIGKYFKYRNCYSLSESEDDYWWAYRAVLDVEDLVLDVFDFEKDKYGGITIHNHASHSGMIGWEECTPLEFANAWKVICDEINNIDY